jgi:ribosomal protein L13
MLKTEHTILLIPTWDKGDMVITINYNVILISEAKTLNKMYVGAHNKIWK